MALPINVSPALLIALTIPLPANAFAANGELEHIKFDGNCKNDEAALYSKSRTSAKSNPCTTDHFRETVNLLIGHTAVAQIRPCCRHIILRLKVVNSLRVREAY